VIEAWSAGIVKHRLDPRAVKVMAEAGVDISGQRSKLISELPVQDFDWVITLCDHANAHCPVFPGRVRRLHRGFDDPPSLAMNAATEGEALSHYRRIRDEIRPSSKACPDSLPRG
jgi:arsenate reductase